MGLKKEEEVRFFWIWMLSFGVCLSYFWWLVGLALGNWNSFLGSLGDVFLF